MIRTLAFSLFISAGIPASCIPADTVKIGLLIPDGKSLAAKNAAELAVKEVNRSTGNKTVFRLEIRAMDGPWGIGARQAVDLVFNRKVTALIACVDGRNAHLAEQVAAKHQILFINAGSGDPTLSRAFIPWYFSCLNDYRQDAVFLSAWFNRKDIRKVIVICDTTYDSGMAASEMVRVLKPAGTETKLIRLKKSSDFRPEDIGAGPKQSVVIITERKTSQEIAKKLNERVRDIHFINVAYREEKAVLSEINGCIVIPAAYNPDLHFSGRFAWAYGYKPGPAAIYTYDAVIMLAEAIKKAGTDREKLQDMLVRSSHKGISGEIRFESHGRRIPQNQLMIVSYGRLIPLLR